MKKTNNRILELADLQRMLISTCNHLSRPLRKSQLIKMTTDLFECNTPKQVEFAIIDLIEQGKLQQEGYFIITPEFASIWDGTVTSTDEWTIKFLLSLKEEAKHDLFFDVYAQEPLTTSSFFKYINMKYPSLLRRQGTALSYMEQMENIFPYGLNSNFYMEMNDYPTDRWFTTFFNNPDCRIFIKNMDISKNHINIQVVLITGKKRSYKKANTDYEEFKQNIPHYFDNNMNVHVRKSLTVISNGRKSKQGKGW